MTLQKNFNSWLYKACEFKGDPHDIFPYIDLTDAKLAFLDGTSSEEYAKNIKK